MATYGPVQLPAYFSGNADFQTWVTGIHNALAGIGLVQTADTGQINPATVALPGATNTAAGYEIWKTNDGGQSYGGQQWYFKIEYGTGATVDRPSIWHAAGSGTNGAGTLTGQLSGRNQVASQASTTPGSVAPLYASGDGSRFMLTCNQASTTSGQYALWIGAERTRNGSGNYTADGLIYLAVNPFTGFGLYLVMPNSGTISALATGLPIIPVMFNTANTGSVHSFGGNIAFGSMVYFLGQPFYGLSVGEIAQADTVFAATFSVVVLGAAHTFIALLAKGPDYTQIANPTVFACLLWE